jgi:hypothetical protein
MSQMATPTTVQKTTIDSVMVNQAEPFQSPFQYIIALS